jgi:hypothetical protein
MEALMIEYTLDEIKLLADLYNSESVKIDIPPKDQTEFGPFFSYTQLMDTVIKEKSTSEASLMEFLGAYESVVYDSTSYNILHEFLFDTPLKNMSLHINKEGQESWMSKVSRWRLKIGK